MTETKAPVTAAGIQRRKAQRNIPGYDANGDALAGLELLDSARAYAGDTLLLAFSGGKDSLAMWLWLREVAPELRLVPFYMDMIPGLSLIDDMLSYYEDFFGVHIYRMLHPVFYHDLNDFILQPPERVRQIRALELPAYERQDVADIVALAAGIQEPRVLHAMGLRRKDNPIRSGLMTVARILGTKTSRHFYPIWDWDTAQVAAIIKRHGAKLPVGYRFWGRNLVNTQYAVLKPLRDNFPAEFAVVQEWYPLVAAEFFRYEVVGRGSGGEREQGHGAG